MLLSVVRWGCRNYLYLLIEHAHGDSPPHRCRRSGTAICIVQIPMALDIFWQLLIVFVRCCKLLSVVEARPEQIQGLWEGL